MSLFSRFISLDFPNQKCAKNSREKDKHLSTKSRFAINASGLF